MLTNVNPVCVYSHLAIADHIRPAAQSRQSFVNTHQTMARVLRTSGEKENAVQSKLVAADQRGLSKGA